MYAVRVSIDVQHDDEVGTDEALTLSWACTYADARSSAEAARWAAAQSPDKISKQMKGAVI